MGIIFIEKALRVVFEETMHSQVMTWRWQLKKLNNKDYVMKLVDSKKREKLSFDTLSKQYGPFPEPEHTESPDFLIRFQNHVVGVEFTEIYSQEKINGTSLRQQEERKNRIVERAKQIAIENNLPPIHVSVMFSKPVEKHREEIVSLKLINAIVSKYPCKGQQITIDSFTDEDFGLPDEISFVLTANTLGYKNHLWHATEVWCAETDFTDQLQKEIDRKSKKYTNYLKKCDECWLVISALGFSRSTAFEPSTEMLEHIYNSPFKRVFFLEAASSYIVELKINTISK
jgi:hypothetical protein